MKIKWGHHRTDNVLGDFCDDQAYKEYLLFSCYPNALEILFYYDEVEVCNPIGLKAKIHKLGT